MLGRLLGSHDAVSAVCYKLLLQITLCKLALGSTVALQRLDVPQNPGTYVKLRPKNPGT